MIIKRIQVEEGFLDGLDLYFSDGLNVVIGPRGSGKTSIIELIRFCLDVEAYTELQDKKSREHALAILESGKVTLTIDNHGEEGFIWCTAESRENSVGPSIELPIILSQGEIETIGIHAAGRLRLNDSFIMDQTSNELRELSQLSDVQSLSSQIRSLLLDIQKIDEDIEANVGISEALVSAEKEQIAISGTIKEIEPQRKELSNLADQSAQLSVQKDVLNRTYSAFNYWIEDLARLIGNSPSIEEWPESAGDTDLLSSFRNQYRELVDVLNSHVIRFNNLLIDLSSLIKPVDDKKIALETKARELRSQVEKVQEGAGVISRKISELREKLGQIESLKSLRAEKTLKIEELKKKRDTRLSEIEELQNSIFQKRQDVVNFLNDTLNPQIDLKVIRSEDYSDYANAIIETLRGSGIKYTTLAPRLAQSISPNELVRAIENGDYKSISHMANIPIDRSINFVNVARAVGVEIILGARVEDGVRMSLLIGTEYKGIEHVSTGQRCTIILPILLCNHGRSLLIDQPEDNLDNAFIVETVIKSMRKAANHNQIICATHNANIPVLGEAERVVSLDSDGQRGFVRHAEELDHPSTVESITTLMEGGREAFEKRAKFYGTWNEDTR